MLFENASITHFDWQNIRNIRYVQLCQDQTLCLLKNIFFHLNFWISHFASGMHILFLTCPSTRPQTDTQYHGIHRIYTFNFAQ